MASDFLSLGLFLGRELLADALLLGLDPNRFLKRLPDSIAMTVKLAIKNGGGWNLNKYAFGYALVSAQRTEIESGLRNNSGMLSQNFRENHVHYICPGRTFSAHRSSTPKTSTWILPRIGYRN